HIRTGAFLVQQSGIDDRLVRDLHVNRPRVLSHENRAAWGDRTWRLRRNPALRPRADRIQADGRGRVTPCPRTPRPRAISTATTRSRAKTCGDGSIPAIC